MTSRVPAELPPEAFMAALAGLRGVGPNRLSRLLEGGSPDRVWSQVVGAQPSILRRLEAPKVAAALPALARAVDVDELWTRYRGLGIGLLGTESAAYPPALQGDPEAPAVLFTKGEPSSVSDLRVGIVGTRQCTRYGVDLARDLGAMCATAGVSVVSGLAAGIDAAAHHGAIAAGGGAPVGVAGTALDSPYPRENRGLWEQVADAGLLCGETPIDAPADRWRFPARNRIIAALSHVVVVVESHEKGGSLYTAVQAMERGRTVFAVPGPIHSPASVGCNRLLADGCLPLCDLSDVLVALGLAASVAVPQPAVALDAGQLQVVGAVGWQASTVTELMMRTALGVGELALVVEELTVLGVLSRRGPWVERTSRAVVASSEQVPAGPREPVCGHDHEVNPGDTPAGWSQGG